MCRGSLPLEKGWLAARASVRHVFCRTLRLCDFSDVVTFSLPRSLLRRRSMMLPSGPSSPPHLTLSIYPRWDVGWRQSSIVHRRCPRLLSSRTKAGTPCCSAQ
ncbi:hypothetical protein MTO96_020360 [Rhipicephalus appendiculatus]